MEPFYNNKKVGAPVMGSLWSYCKRDNNTIGMLDAANDLGVVNIDDEVKVSVIDEWRGCTIWPSLDANHALLCSSPRQLIL